LSATLFAVIPPTVTLKKISLQKQIDEVNYCISKMDFHPHLEFHFASS
jgi:hypothetical protein